MANIVGKKKFSAIFFKVSFELEFATFWTRLPCLFAHGGRVKEKILPMLYFAPTILAGVYRL
ncbi:MAG: hypothetical protein A3E26_06275 [Chlamydiae bacterium RIFCSPHIGHO2_12_FULL_49_32]|nr:MAG: hypothetical protein A3E26_06275 [Chlamydiae bacterium RIFCSPHIGHO2_12_FULL_49_32]